MGRLRSALALLFISSVLACQVVPSDVVKQIVPERTDYKTLEAAYHVLLERHVDKPSSQQLLNGALDGASRYFGSGPAESPAPSPGVAGCASVKVERPDFTGSTESDLVRAGEALDKAAAQCAAVNKTLLERAATDGMARSMNECHTYYLDPDRAKGFNQPPQPYSGIGATVIPAETQGGPVRISTVFGGSPAEKAGLQGGDQIKSVDDVEVTGFTPEEVAMRIRGPEGTVVRLTVVRGGQEKQFSITRATLTPPRVFATSHDNGAIVQLQVNQLNGDVADSTRDAVRRALGSGARAFILDLRGNPGGDLSAAVDIASIFLKNATLVDQVGRDGKKEQVRTDDKFFVSSSVPVVVLVNERSASGAEIIAAGLHSNGIASVVGTRTAGCVGIAQPRQLPDEGLLLVTLARMQDVKTHEELNGKGRGVAPDISVKNDPNTPEEDDLVAAIAAARQKIAALP